MVVVTVFHIKYTKHAEGHSLTTQLKIHHTNGNVMQHIIWLQWWKNNIKSEGKQISLVTVPWVR